MKMGSLLFFITKHKISIHFNFQKAKHFMRLHLDISKFNSILFTLIFIFSMTESTVLSYYFTLSNPISLILLTLLISFNFKKQ